MSAPGECSTATPRALILALPLSPGNISMQQKGMSSRRAMACIVTAVLCISIARAAEPEPKTDEQKTLYALGLAISQNLAPFNLSAADLDMVKAGLSDGVLGKTPRADLQTYGPKIQTLQQTRSAAVADKEKKAGKAYAD